MADGGEHTQIGDEPIPLQHAWVFWHDKYDTNVSSAESYAANLKKIFRFETVQAFWECFNNLPVAERLNPKSALHLMADGVKPVWEDPTNANGGIWTFRVSKKDSQEVWRELVLAAIGEQFAAAKGTNDEINGVSVSPRNNDDLIFLWNKNASDTCQEKVHNQVIKILPPTVKIEASFYKPCQKS